MRELARLVAALAAGLILARGFAFGGSDGRIVLFAVAATLVVTFALGLWTEAAVTISAGALVTAYAGSLYVAKVAADPWVPIVAGLLVLYVEACDVAAAAAPATPVDRALLRAAVRRIGLRAVLGAVAAAFVVGVAALPAAPSAWLRIAGMAGAAAALAAPILMLRRR